MATQPWSAYEAVFPVDRDTPIHRAGWTVVQEPVQRIRSLVNAMHSHVEDAWEAGHVAAAIRRAQRYQRLQERQQEIEAAFPDLQAHGPLQHWHDMMLLSQASLNRFWQRVGTASLERMNAFANETLHGRSVRWPS